VYANGDVYDGQFRGKLREGLGKYTCRDITGREGHYKEYIGEWLRD
jgi:uncharacterized protein YjbJ (UPF0337 family)